MPPIVCRVGETNYTTSFHEVTIYFSWLRNREHVLENIGICGQNSAIDAKLRWLCFQYDGPITKPWLWFAWSLKRLQTRGFIYSLALWRRCRWQRHMRWQSDWCPEWYIQYWSQRILLLAVPKSLRHHDTKPTLNCTVKLKPTQNLTFAQPI